MKLRILNLICIAALIASASACGNRNGKDSNAGNNEQKEETMEKVQIPEEPVIRLETNFGTMRIKLYKKTPKHRDNFIKLVKSGFYDSLRFHRVIEGFMIQGGDPNSRDTSKIDSWGMGGPGYTVPAEIVNEYYHKKGAIAAARKGDMANPTKASSGSQFYIVQDEMNCIHLDGEYTIFGETIEGLDVIDKIAAVETDRYDRPYEDVFILKAELELPEAEKAQPDSTDAEASDSTSTGKPADTAAL